MLKRIVSASCVLLVSAWLAESAQATIIKTDSGLVPVVSPGTNATEVASWVAAMGDAPVNSADNLLQNHLSEPAFLIAGGMAGGSLSNVNDGLLVSNGGTNDSYANLAWLGSGAQVVFKLDGFYDIGSIATLTNWNGFRIGQRYDIRYSSNGGTTWSWLADIEFAHTGSGDQDYLRRITTSDSVPGTPILTQINALKFGFTAVPTNWNTAIYSEIAAYAVPEPSMLVLAASGLMGLLAYAWRKRK